MRFSSKLEKFYVFLVLIGSSSYVFYTFYFDHSFRHRNGLLNEDLHAPTSKPTISPTHNPTIQPTPAPTFERVSLGIAVLIQQSPLDSANQIERLKTIDESWARWSRISKKTEIRIYAAVPRLSTSVDGFENIRSLTIEPDYAESAMKKLQHSIWGMLSNEYESYAWFFICNDHTFVIPQNLKCFTKDLDHHDVIYTGNKLAVHHQDSPLLFASGGAGILMSKVTLQIIVLSWVLSGDPVMLGILERNPAECKILSEVAKSIHGDFLRIQAEGSTDDRTEAGMNDPDFGLTLPIRCILQLIFDWMNQKVYVKALQTLHVTLSSKLLLEIYYEKGKGEFNKHVKISLKSKIMDSFSVVESVITLDPEALLRCSAKSDWEQSNPGIVLSHCLQRIYKVKFTQSVSDYRPDKFERFNVYNVLRTSTRDFDQWYKDAKQLSQIKSSEDREAEDSRNVISFHYVSSSEAKLLYFMLNDLHPRLRNGVHREALVPLGLQPVNPESILKFWPKDENNAPSIYTSQMTDIAQANKVYIFLKEISSKCNYMN